VRFFIIYMLLTVMLFAAHVDETAKKFGFFRSYPQALASALKEHKVLLLLITKEECTWCVRFERRTLANKRVYEELKHNFIVVMVDKHTQKESYPSKRFKAPFTPRGFFIDPRNQKTIAISNGYMKAEDFLRIIDEVKRKWKRQ